MFSAGPISHAQTEDAPKLFGQFSGTVAFVTDYRYRGVSETDEAPAIQGSLDWSHDDGQYFGVWASNVDYGDNDASSEFDTYFGVAKELDGTTLDVSAIYVSYPGSDDNDNYFEFAFGVEREFSQFAFSSGIDYIPEYEDGYGDLLYFETGAEAPLPNGVTVAGHLGRQWTTGEDKDKDAEDYFDWSIGLNYSIHGLDFSVTYIDTDLSPVGCDNSEVGGDDDGCDATVVFGVSRSF